MDAGDFNKDGLTDLVLGNFAIGAAMMKPTYDWQKGPAFIVLQNMGRREKIGVRREELGGGRGKK